MKQPQHKFTTDRDSLGTYKLLPSVAGLAPVWRTPPQCLRGYGLKERVKESLPLLAAAIPHTGRRGIIRKTWCQSASSCGSPHVAFFSAATAAASSVAAAAAASSAHTARAGAGLDALAARGAASTDVLIAVHPTAKIKTAYSPHAHAGVAQHSAYALHILAVDVFCSASP